jgi:hypothetical protein
MNFGQLHQKWMNGNPYFSVPDSYYLGRDVYAKNTIFSRCKTHCRLTAWIQKEFRAQTFAVNSINSRRIGTLLLSLLLLLLHVYAQKHYIFEMPNSLWDCRRESTKNFENKRFRSTLSKVDEKGTLLFRL